MHFKVHQLLMQKYWRWGVKMGRTTLETPVEKYFGFNAFDVDRMYHHKVGDGQGIWFRLLDGRVIDWQGVSSDPDPSLYDATVN
jgi:hypothetical protein